ncbi:hypothetical protein CHS0354_008773 [Potamilus streckersoni]|uniref:THAP-type domain-containing protein n=1 Tax=Potamilus streckersoni TaxID=2493646 RepID=A0AAE0VZA7_9BIVA|nr:hypothetical protein CHS0354_008773 [Potamilus streckersoni]
MDCCNKSRYEAELSYLVAYFFFSKIVTNTVVCRRYFKQQDYRWTPNRRRLKPDAVSSIFPWTTEEKQRKSHAQKVYKNILEEVEIPGVDIYNESQKSVPGNSSPETSDE